MVQQAFTYGDEPRKAILCGINDEMKAVLDATISDSDNIPVHDSSSDSASSSNGAEPSALHQPSSSTGLASSSNGPEPSVLP